MPRYTLLHGAAEVVAVSQSADVEFLSGPEMGRPLVYRSKGGLSLLCSARVEAIGEDADLEKIVEEKGLEVERISVAGMCLVPGFVDGHTHPVWAGDRSHEFEMKLAGATYMEVHEAGGGIHFTVGKTREAAEADLKAEFLNRCERMIKSGTTMMEAKSGYGLDEETEMKMLRVIDEGAKELEDRLTISGTYCGAHAVPKGKSAGEQTDEVVRQLGLIRLEKEAGRLSSIENCDVFCERGVFSLEQSRFILAQGRAAGLVGNFHGEELSCLGSAEMGAEGGVRAISHLEEVADTGVEAMAAARIAGVLLPTTAYILKLRSPPARLMISSGVPVALGSDFNPNAFCTSMPMVMNFASVLFGMTLGESLVAATLNAAYSLGRGKTHGCLQVGRAADIVAIRAPKWQHLIYQMGAHSDIIAFVIKGGKVVHQS